ncbi:hypothetical protein DVJ83_14190 (plasmid) [Deinococcus wulumuqiensis]|uniref:Flippase n=1 Tax=Deinococcus wulumuqiensis TaxID=980427 RepID=A0A345IKV5_9DEIO|nr:oligosaccharide flippase family protein [Deinococcus wulumuqiensis]AXH00328.1 hypothetical protein DVJ83_14190 [Deinococcus wulumuqiensis]
MLKGILKDGMSLVMIQIAGYFLPLISLPYLTRVLGKEEFGRYSIIFACVTIIGVFSDFGYVTNGTKRVAIHINDKRYLSNLVKSATALRIVLCVFAFLLFLILSQRIIGNIDLTSWSAIILAILGNAIVTPWLFQGMNKISHYSIFVFLVRILSVLLVFVSVKSPDDLRWAIWLNFLPQIMSMIYLFWFLRQNDIEWGVSNNIQAIKFEFLDGLHYFAPNMYSILFTNLGIVALGVFQSSAIAGAYSANERLVKAVASLSGAINQAVYPMAAREMHRSKSEGIKFIRKISLYVIPIFAIFTLILILFGGNLIEIIFGEEYLETSSVMRYLPLYIVLACVNTFIGVIYMTTSGKHKEYGAAFFWGTLIAVLIYCLAPRYIGYHAPAVGLVVGELVILLVIMGFIWRRDV